MRTYRTVDRRGAAVPLAKPRAPLGGAGVRYALLRLCGWAQVGLALAIAIGGSLAVGVGAFWLADGWAALAVMLSGLSFVLLAAAATAAAGLGVSALLHVIEAVDTLDRRAAPPTPSTVPADQRQPAPGMRSAARSDGAPST